MIFLSQGHSICVNKSIDERDGERKKIKYKKDNHGVLEQNDEDKLLNFALNKNLQKEGQKDTSDTAESHK